MKRSELWGRFLSLAGFGSIALVVIATDSLATTSSLMRSIVPPLAWAIVGFSTWQIIGVVRGLINDRVHVDRHGFRFPLSPFRSHVYWRDVTSIDVISEHSYEFLKVSIRRGPSRRIPLRTLYDPEVFIDAMIQAWKMSEAPY